MGELKHAGTRELETLITALPAEILAELREAEKKEGIDGESPEVDAALDGAALAELKGKRKKLALRMGKALSHFEFNMRSLILLSLLDKHELLTTPRRKAFEDEANQIRFEEALSAWLKATD